VRPPGWARQQEHVRHSRWSRRKIAGNSRTAACRKLCNTQWPVLLDDLRNSW
jgi:hypothetical protein